MPAHPKVLVLGGGFAALETAFLLRMRHRDDLDIRVVAADDRFLFRPNSIYVPFGADPGSLLVDLNEPMRRRDIDFERGRVVEVDPDGRLVTLDDGERFGYDKLVIATGADTSPDEIPGLAAHAATIWTTDSMLDVRRRFESVRDRVRAGERRRVLFLVPPNNKCSGPLYEIALMFETWLRRNDARDRVDITWSTYEHGYIQAFGPRLHEHVAEEFAGRGIDGHVEEAAVEVGAGEVRYADGSARGFDELIAFPPYVAAVRYPALDSDERGFVATDPGTRLAAGHDDVYVPGDAGDFPIKQAFLAFLQADAVANHIDAGLRGRDFDQPFDPVSMCIMEMLDKATFAQVPVEVTGDPDRPVRVRPDGNGGYKVGTSPVWRLGKKMLGFSVPMRFSAGEPFHAGRAWQAMDVGIKAMSAMLAD
ncbi:MAG: FAD-dependent oxidoreductase [Thermoleophilia bacterium]|nr:FAD-dependent oxidoreductase [Thermoleophilia bacterium]